jgi:hypothetical protein
MRFSTFADLSRILSIYAAWIIAMKGQAAGAADIMILIESYHDPR